MREWVALAVLGVAAAFGFMFFDPTSTDGDSAPPGTISLGEPAPTRSLVTPSPTTTPIPVKQLKEPGGSWYILYYTRAATGGETRSAEGFAERLAIDAAGRPFPDFPDDAWRAEASQQVTLEPGRYGFRLETDGAVRVTVGEVVVLEAEDAGSPQTRVVEFDHAGGGTDITISIRDSGGPVRLRWAE